jgi:hypothetical protein
MEITPVRQRQDFAENLEAAALRVASGFSVMVGETVAHFLFRFRSRSRFFFCIKSLDAIPSVSAPSTPVSPSLIGSTPLVDTSR